MPFLIRNRVRHCLYIDASLISPTLAKLTAGLFGVVIQKFEFRMRDVFDEKGRAIRMRLTSQEMARLQEDIVAQSEFQEWLKEHEHLGPRIATSLTKSIATRDPGRDFDLWLALYLVWLCRHRTLRDSRGGGAVLFLKHRPWFGSLTRYAAALQIRLEPVSAFPPIKRLLMRRLSPKTSDLLRFLRAHGLGGLRLWLSGKEVFPVAPKRPRLAVEYYGHLNLDDATRPSNLFFWRKSKIKSEDILILFGLFNDRLDSRRLAEIRRHGLDAVAIHPSAVSDISLPLFIPRVRHETTIAPSGKGDMETLWLEERTSDYASRRAFWAELFERTGVKVFFSWYKNDPTHCAIADALQGLGGVTAIYQRSFEANQDLGLTVDADIHFAFSRASVDLGELNRSNIRYNVVTGYFGDYLFAPLRQRARELRESLLKSGAHKIVAVFDEYSKPDARWTPGHDFQKDNYRLLLEKVLSEPWLGVIFKPKRPKNLHQRLGPEVTGLLLRAQATGRCRVLERSDFLSEQTPAEAAMAADIAIHGHISAGTAGMEAALAGVPTLLIDPEGFLDSPFYRLGEGRVVFKDWGSLWEALQRHWDTPSGTEGFGDWSPLLDEFDPFRDGRAAERIGEFLDSVLQHLKDGHGREASMAAAASRYTARWGQDKITEIRGPAWLRPRDPSRRVRRIDPDTARSMGPSA
ncbi:MAG TPA: hypothetical protein DCZ01_05060 [Elusimicrobia bacterium]|nr:MAG: hypothetical protein A2X40_00690 [Elusimicrobia bacterium GWC2_65_9]HAZ07893.1 hypothetical protein [Elusimicrobiota bacterium]